MTPGGDVAGAGRVYCDGSLRSWPGACAVPREAFESVSNMASERKTKLSKNLLRMKVLGSGDPGESGGEAEL